MSLKDRVQVEALDDDRWSRIERGVVASVRTRDVLAKGVGPRPWARWGLGASAGVLAAAAAATLVVWRHGANAGAKPMTVATEARGTRIEVGDAVVQAAPETSFTVAHPSVGSGEGVEIALARGRIELAVPHRPDRAPLIVHAGDVDVVDVGTVFAVTRTGGAGVTVEVREGEVQVARAGQVARVVAGQRWDEPVVASVGASAGDTNGANGANGAGAQPGGAGAGANGAGVNGANGAGANGGAATPPKGGDSGRVSGEPYGGTSGTPTTVASRDRGASIPVGGPGDLLQRGHTATAPDGAPEATGSGAGAGAASHRHDRGRDVHATSSTGARGAAGGGGVITDLPAAIRAVPVEPAADVGAASPADAFAVYRTRYTSGDADASKMLYGMARAQFAAGHTDDALRWLEAYVERFTSGDEAEAVLWLRVRILCTRGSIDDACRAAAQTYLGHGRDAARSKIAQLITDTIR